MKTLELAILPGRAETLAASGEVAESLLDELAAALGLATADAPPGVSPAAELTDAAPEPGGAWKPWGGWYVFPGRMEYLPEECRLRVCVGAGELTAEHRMRILRRVLYFSLLRRLQSADAALLHGALLSEPGAAYGAVLFAESGMGKSAAAARMAAQGGVCHSDDRLLLIFGAEGEVFARPLPTWSRYPDMPRADYGTLLEVRGLFMLFRGEDDRVIPADRANWRIALCRSLADALSSPRDWLPPELRTRWIDLAMAPAVALERRFGARQLCGDLNGHIREHLSRELSDRRKRFRLSAPRLS